MIFISGSPQSGKTGTVLDIVEQAAGKGLRVAGIAVPGLWESDLRAGFDLMELDTGNVYPLSRRVRGLRPMPFMFDAQGIQNGRRALSVSRCREADLVVVDEVGRLELGGDGWAPCLGPLLRLDGSVHLWVVRTSLVKAVQKHFRVRASVFSVEDNPGAFERIYQEINMLWKNSGG
jgi:nucleoside-triphosphatase THEP1